VAKYRAFRDELQIRNVALDVDHYFHVLFLMPPAASWSEKKRQRHYWQPHRQRPDLDNMVKALLDGLFSEDSHAWSFGAEKIWSPIAGFVIGVQAPGNAPHLRKRYVESVING
jgi:Holliday junction resolvase RusA-like endonuclease